jgi:initiation factor 1A
MPKKNKSYKNRKNTFEEKRALVTIADDDDEQVYGVVQKALGSRFFDVKCFPNKKVRRCRVRTKRMRISIGDVVVIALRDFNDDTGDIVYKYDHEEARNLQRRGEIPDVDHIDEEDEENVDDDVKFEFDDI